MRTIVNRGLAALCLCLGARLQAAGPTIEDDAWGDLESGGFPLALSGDGNWRVHLDADNVLHRARLDDTAVEQVTLPVPALSLSVSRDASVVSFATRAGCIGIADFAALDRLHTTLDDSSTTWTAAALRSARWLAQAFAEPPLRWLKKPAGESDYPGDCPGSDDARPIGAETEPGMTPHPRVAISADGRRIALGGPSFWNPSGRLPVIDIATGEVVRQLPSEGVTLRLRFIDDDRALYTEQAVLGAPYEGTPAPSDLRFAIWDLHSGDLLHFVDRRPGESLGREDFLTDFSTRSRHVHLLQIEADRRDPENPAVKLHIRSADLGRCGAAFDEGWTMPIGWHGFAADPNGAWVAVSRDAQDEADSHSPARLALFDARTGRELRGFEVDEPLRNIVVTQDGRALFATTRAEYRSDGNDGFERVRKGGDLRRFDVGEVPTAPGRADDHAAACPIEDEQRGAREVAADDTPRPAAYTRDLLTVHEASRIADKEQRPPIPAVPAPGQCGPNWDIEMRRTWGIADDGTLWLDRYRYLENVDPADGHRLGIVATPRREDRCAIVWYEKKQFVEAVDESVLLLPFKDDTAPPPVRALANKPGWRALAIEERDSHLLVRWADKRWLGKNDAPEGSAVGTLYDLASGDLLAEYPGRLYGEQGNIVLDVENEESGEGVDPFAANAPSPRGTYTWQRSYFGSVRAVERASADRAGGTVLWVGLHVGEPGETDVLPDVRGLGGSLGAAIRPDRIEIYDAAKRRRVARLPLAYVLHVSWHAPSRQLFVESSGDPTLRAIPLP